MPSFASESAPEGGRSFGLNNDSSSPVKPQVEHRDTSPPEISLIPSNEVLKNSREEEEEEEKEEEKKSGDSILLQDDNENSAATATADTAADADAAATRSYKPSSSDMLYYYERLLPFKSIFLWLNHSPVPNNDFINREFAFEFKSGAYQRYNSFSSYQDFKQQVVKSNPTRFEIGAIYTLPPNKRKVLSNSKNVLKPLEKELVFDIDLTDYDEVRSCCSKTDICEKCWMFIDIAIEIVESGLKQDFGFKHLIWIFSGRRGIHCWVSDKNARSLNDPQRRAIIEYFDISKENVLRKPYHPLLEKSFNIIYNNKKNYFENFLKNQNIKNDFLIDKLKSYNTNESQLLFNKQSILELSNYLESNPNLSGFEKLSILEKFLPQSKSNINNKKLLQNLKDFKKDLVLFLLYPKLDLEVSKQTHHLLKSPFAVHPGTGNISIPIHIGFNPLTSALNLRDLINANEGLNKDNNTSLDLFQKSIATFDDFAKSIIKDEGVKKREAEDLLDF
ncbi:hypothetical protein PACTADRAFT_52154 [Pachysolen tannophilus NRRL Y-2460]|uniref:DNA primase n=1 Tax=Pachysolen tannophilus NRRL Y-2460 TaxID=669874 RepID=A0A1E4TMU5_PACTA|nr:hypothetical protein PACTADRAFT_52154 [Pachysolen tannophilus NRRL Y-2460]